MSLGCCQPLGFRVMCCNNTPSPLLTDREALGCFLYHTPQTLGSLFSTWTFALPGSVRLDLHGHDWIPRCTARQQTPRCRAGGAQAGSRLFSALQMPKRAGLSPVFFFKERIAMMGDTESSPGYRAPATVNKSEGGVIPSRSARLTHSRWSHHTCEADAEHVDEDTHASLTLEVLGGPSQGTQSSEPPSPFPWQRLRDSCHHQPGRENQSKALLAPTSDQLLPLPLQQWESTSVGAAERRGQRRV